MTQDPMPAGGLSAEHVSELQRQLAEASAQVAQVQAQLARAQLTQAPAVPYADPSLPHGLDLGSLLSSLGGLVGGPVPSSEPVAPLADPPRPVPWSFRLATFDLSWYELFLLVILTAAPIAVWIYFPAVVPAALLLAVAVIATFRGRRYARRIGMLKWGEVADVTHHEVVTQGTYYGGVTYNNMRKRTARGWDVSTLWYSGPAYTNKVDYTLDGVAGSLTYRGLLYTNGVVLADSRNPARALCVVEFPYSVKPGPDGQLTGEVSLGRWVGIAVTVFVEALVVVLAVEAVLELWVR